MPSGTTRVFDSHWANRPGVDPAALWQNTMYPASQTAQYNSTQSENPLNYVGWVNMPYNVTDSEASAANRDLLSTSAAMERTKITSKVLIWQGDLLDGGLVGTYGIRKDRVQGWQRSINNNSNAGTYKDAPTVDPTREYGYLMLDKEHFFLPEQGSDFEKTSKSWSIVAHFDELPFFKKATENWPIHISGSYSQSENFQPAALRVNLYGEALPLPSGTTKDASLPARNPRRQVLVPRDQVQDRGEERLKLRTQNAGFIGTIMARGTNWANQFEYDFGTGNQPSNHVISAQVNGRPAGAPQPPGWTEQNRPGNPTWDPTNSLYNFGQGANDPTQADADVKEKAGHRRLARAAELHRSPLLGRVEHGPDLAVPPKQPGWPQLDDAAGLHGHRGQHFGRLRVRVLRPADQELACCDQRLEDRGRPQQHWRRGTHRLHLEARDGAPDHRRG